MNGRPIAITVRSNPDVSSALPKPVRTAPGCSEFAVTPVPASRRANSTVKSTLASFDWL
jgi:hypothetical protein